MAIEQAHVDKVYLQLEVATESARHVEAESRARYTSSRDEWLREEAGTALFERDAFAYQAAKRLATLDAEHEGLVFGRLDLHREEPRYIGRIGVRDEDYEPLVIDWRAPAAEPFYRATSVNPMNVIRRRVLRCRDDKVIGIEDDLLDPDNPGNLRVLGEGALMAALGRARGPRMRDIVATIQAEQDEAIRAPYPGVTVISGGPGTGKTVVALHRAAYLLYTNRKRLERGGVLVVGPSAIFMNYIERVLPGLGEDSVTLRSLGQLAGDVLGLTSDHSDPAAAASLKGSLAMVRLLRRLVVEPLARIDALTLRVSIKGVILQVDGDQAVRLRRSILASHKSNQARQVAERQLLDLLWARVPADIEVSREDFDELIRGQAGWRMFVNAWWPVLQAEDVLARLADPEVLARTAQGLLDADQQETLRTSIGAALAAGRDWTIADIALLDELVAIIGPEPVDQEEGPDLFLDSGSEVAEVVTTADLLSDRRVEIDPDAEPQATYAHILVDESQDVTPMQWRMLRRRGPQASWTLVGDPAQSSYPYPEETDRAVRELIGHAPRRTFRLSTNYRSPAEVFNLAARVITKVQPDADLPFAARTTGVDPLLLHADPQTWERVLVDQLRSLAEQVEGSIALIVPPSWQTRAGELLTGGALPARLRTRIVLVTALQSKGLEYDAVVVLSPDDIVRETPGGVHVLYVALTRPTQRLVTLDVTAEGSAGHWLS